MSAAVKVGETFGVWGRTHISVIYRLFSGNRKSVGRTAEACVEVGDWKYVVPRKEWTANYGHDGECTKVRLDWTKMI